jgi:HEPN domain-containing protein
MNSKDDWFMLAQDDKRMVELALAEEIYNQVCFHAQQGVEKMLRGYLCARGRPIQKTHFLIELLEECTGLEQDFEQIRQICKTLDQYYIPTRYPDALPGVLPEGLPDKKKATEAYNSLLEAVKLVERLIPKL